MTVHRDYAPENDPVHGHTGPGEYVAQLYRDGEGKGTVTMRFSASSRAQAVVLAREAARRCGLALGSVISSRHEAKTCQ